MKNIKLPPKEIRDYIELKNGNVFALPNMLKEAKLKFIVCKTKWKLRQLTFR